MSLTDIEVRRRIEDEFFLKARAISVQWQIEGNRINDDGTVVIGGRAGPIDNIETSNLVHEMAHFVEIDDFRCGRHGWGLKVPTVTVMGQTCAEPLTCRAVQRELRVFSLQVNLLNYLDAENDLDDFVRALRFMPDYLFVPSPGATPGDYSSKDAARHAWCLREVAKLRKQTEYQPESFIKEWWRKDGLLWRRLKRRAQDRKRKTGSRVCG